MQNILKKVKAKLHQLKYSFIDTLRILIGTDPPIKSEGFDLSTLPLLLGKEDPVILDIGCNDGNHTLRFIELFTNSKVFAFEPDPRARTNFQVKNKSERVKLFGFAISDNDGSSEFYLSNGNPSPEWSKSRPEGYDLSGSIKKPKGHLVIFPWCTFENSIVVETKKLDTWSSEEGISSIDFIWADVQGAEENLIKGALKSLEKTRYFYTEYSNSELYSGQISLRKIRSLLPNFEVVHRYSNDILFKNKNLY